VEMNILVFGTYDLVRHPRAAVLVEGLRGRAASVTECNEPLGFSTAERVEMLRRPWRTVAFIARLAGAWLKLWRRSRRFGRPDAVLVPYMGHFDVLLARRRWPGALIVLDHLIFAEDTARDRGIQGGIRAVVLGWIDRAALSRADVIVVDTAEHLSMIPEGLRNRAHVVPVGAESGWFHAPDSSERDRIRVIFFGLFTPLHGASFVGEALRGLSHAPIDVTMVGTGQDYRRARQAAGDNPNIRWIDWLPAADLRRAVAEADICLGIFGTTTKARRVVPNKVFQGAASGCAILTSDTEPQRRALGEAGLFVPAGSPDSLRETLLHLANDRKSLRKAQKAAYSRARSTFSPEHVVSVLEPVLLQAIVGPEVPAKTAVA